MDDIVAILTDLYFQSRIYSAAQSVGRPVRLISTQDVLAAVQDFNIALVDLDTRLDAVATIQLLRARGSGQIVVFGPHLQTEQRKAARRAGADRVLAKSKFVTELPILLGVAPATTFHASSITGR